MKKKALSQVTFCLLEHLIITDKWLRKHYNKLTANSAYVYMYYVYNYMCLFNSCINNTLSEWQIQLSTKDITATFLRIAENKTNKSC